MDGSVEVPAPRAAGLARGVIAVIVTRDRPELLRRCLCAVFAQDLPPERVLVIDNASGPQTRAVVQQFPRAELLRLDVNLGGAGGFYTGMRAALAGQAAFIWLMDDDGWPRHADCLRALLDAAAERDIVAPLVLDEDRPHLLAFPIRIQGRTRFTAAAVRPHGTLTGMAHLFNGALVRGALVRRIGPPDPRFFMRGDEVEFCHRARRAGARIALLTSVEFLHPGSSAEVHPIMGGLFYAVVPATAAKRFLQFRNRGFIFRSYGMWLYLAADMVRYGWYFLISRRGDARGLAQWCAATWLGVRGRLEPRGAEP